MRKKKIVNFCKKVISSALVTTLLLGSTIATELYYSYSNETAYAASLSSASSSGGSVTIGTQNISSAVINDASTCGVNYYFDGNDTHRYLQLNARGAQDNGGTPILKNAASTSREMVGTYASKMSQWVNEEVVNLGGKIDPYLSSEIKYLSTESGSDNFVTLSTYTFLPSSSEYSANSEVAGLVYDRCGNNVWSRSGGYGNAYGVCDSDGRIRSISMSGMGYSYAPAFNLDLSKALIARSATSGASATTSSALSTFNKDSAGTAVKFLAKGDGSKVTVSGISSGSTLNTLVAGSTYSFSYSMTNANYLSAVIMDGSGNIKYYGVLAKGKSGSANITIPSGLSGTYYLGLFDETRNGSYKTDTCGDVSVYKFTAAAKAANGAKLVTDGIKGKTYKPGDTLAVGSQVTYKDTYNDGTEGSNSTSGVTISLNGGSKVSSATLPTNVKGNYSYTLYKGNYTLGTGSIYMDYQTGIDKINAKNTNPTSLSPGASLNADNIAVNYTSSKSTINNVCGKGGAGLVKLITETDYSSAKPTSWLDSKLVSSITIPGGTEGNYSYRYAVKNQYLDEIYYSDAITVNVDAHAKVNIVNSNDENLSLGDTIYANKITATYEVTGSSIDSSVSSDDIYVIAASDWNGNESKDNAKLAKEIKVPDAASGTFDYYIVIKDTTSAKGYWAGMYTVDCSENATGFDANVWYTYKDEKTNIEWNYKLDGNGDIIGLYTKSGIVGIVDSGEILNIPAKVAGRTVVKIGGGDENTPVVPASETSWSKISLPESVTTINDFAFYQTKAQAQITIPSTVKAIGIKAFYQSDITGVKLTEMNGTIGSYAFGKTTKLNTVSIKGGSEGLTVSSVAFADTSMSDLTIKGNVELNKKAFRGNTSLESIKIFGDVSIGEGAFSGCSAVTSLTISGNTDITSYAFDSLTSLTSLYLPAGTKIDSYSFNGLTSLSKLETDISLPANSFANGGKIETLILDENVSSISYDWEGHTSTVAARKVYIKNKDMLIEYYSDGSNYYSALGSSGNITVKVPFAQDTDMGTDVQASNGVLKLNGYTSYAHSNYNDYVKGKASSVKFNTSTNIADDMINDNVGSLKDADTEKVQTGIDAFYNGMILTTKDLDKEKMTVTKMYGSDDGEKYASDEFYVIRTSDFNKESAGSNVTEDVIKSYEPVTAENKDLSSDTTGSVAVTVVVFYNAAGSGGETVRKYYSAPVSIRVESYTAKSYIEQQYGSYENIANKLVEYENQINALKQELAKADVDSIEKLTTELAKYKQAYADLTKLLEKYVSNNTTDNSGYFGKADDGNGNKKDVIYINGTPSDYTDTGKTDAEGNKIYKTSYDVNGDGVAETIYVIVKDDGVHLVDADGNPIKNTDGIDIVYKDTLGALQRKLAAQIAAIESELKKCDDGLAAIKAALNDAGITIDPDSNVDEYTQIVNAVKKLAAKVESLNTDLTNANDQIKNYSGSLDTIYSQLTGSTLDKDGIEGLTNVLNAIISKVQKLQSDLSVANATVADLQSQINSAETQISQLQSELDTTKADLEKAESNITKANEEKAALTKQYEDAIAAGDAEAAKQLQAQINEKNAYIAELETTKNTLTQKEQDLKDAQDTVKQLQKQLESKNNEIAQLKAELDAINSAADSYKVTADVANKMFGLTIKDGASADEIKAAIQGYVSTMTAYKDTIGKIQTAVKSTNEGDALVADVKKAVAEGNGNTNTGTDDTVVNKDSASYKQGVTDGKASVDTSSNSETYKNGYNAGYKDGLSETNKNNSNIDTNTAYTNGYNAGYSAGASANNGSSNNQALVSQLANLSSEVGTLTSKNSSLTEQVSSLEGEKASLNEQVSSLQDENAALQEQVSNLESDVSYLRNSAVTTGAMSSNVQESELVDEEPIEEDEPATVAEEEIPTKATGLIVASSLDNTMMNMGEYKSIELPSNLTKDSMQKASSNINDNIELNANITSSNAASYSSLKVNKTDTAYTAKTEKLNNAKKIIAYYADNLTELGNLGWKQLQVDSANKDKIVTFDELMSVDFKASATQLETIKAGDGARLTISSDKFEDGATYFVVHESETRTGIYDILLTRSNGNTLDITVPDLSPVTIAKVSISDNNNSAQETTTTAPVELEVKKDNGGKVMAVTILFIIAIIALGALFIMAKKRNNGINPFKRK